MPQITKVYLGVEQVAKKDWATILGDPKKPGNWKEETYLAKKAEMQEKQAEEAPTHLAAGKPGEMCIIIDSGPGMVSDELCGQATDVLDAMAALVVGLGSSMVQIIGFDTLAKLRQAAWHVAKDKGKPVPGWLWNTDTYPNVINLYSCSGAKNDSDMSLQEFINYWMGIPADVDPNRKDSKSQAVLEARCVQHIASCMGM